MFRRIAALLAGLTASVTGCAPRVVHPDPPEPPTLDAGLDEPPCGDVSAGGEPLVVDWRPDRRGILESGLGHGIVVVHYDCKRFEVLEDCTAEGAYGFMGFGMKEQVVRLLTADELRANLPLSGVGLATDLAADMQRGASLDIAMALIGRRATTRKSLRRADLAGACQDATHFVKSAVIGAFAISQGSRAEAGTAAKVFGAGASARGKISRLAATKDGDIAACSSATSTSLDAPAGCGAVLRVGLMPLTEALEAASPNDGERRESCIAGLVFSQGKCVAPAAEVPHVCRPDEPQDCLTQCERESAESCTVLGRYYRDVLQPKDDARARWALERACSLGEHDGCASLGAMLLYGDGGPKDEERAHQLFRTACDRGAPRGCYNAAAAHRAGVRMEALGFVREVPEAVGPEVVSLFVRACDGGYWAGCSAAGSMYMDGKGIPVDAPNAAKYRSRACDGNFANACSNYGWQLLNGRGVSPDPMRALRAYSRGCELGDDVGCSGLGFMLRQGLADSAAFAAGKELLRRRCDEHGQHWACQGLQGLGP